MKRPSHYELLALAGLLLAWMVITVQVPASAQDAARVYLAPAEPVLTVGETARLAIRVTGAADLYGVELHLAYDPAVLEIRDADTSQAGVQLSPGDMLDPGAGFMIANRADNQAGELDYALTLLAPAEAVS
ncbi:MAG: cohesin domain-containing protein, partial [Candidatus Promineifilaceae bacterium]